VRKQLEWVATPRLTVRVSCKASCHRCGSSTLPSLRRHPPTSGKCDRQTTRSESCYPRGELVCRRAFQLLRFESGSSCFSRVCCCLVCVLYQVGQPLSTTDQLRRTLSNLLTSLELSNHVSCCSEALLSQLFLCLVVVVLHCVFFRVVVVCHDCIITSGWYYVKSKLKLFLPCNQVRLQAQCSLRHRRRNKLRRGFQ